MIGEREKRKNPRIIETKKIFGGGVGEQISFSKKFLKIS
jgi:hypothetical protein